MGFVRQLLTIVAVLLSLTVALLWIQGAVIDPASWSPEPAPAWEGALARNEGLRHPELLARRLVDGPEDVAPDDAWLYTGNEDGTIRRFLIGGGVSETSADTGGRPLGLDLDSSGRLWIADSSLGLLSLEPGGELVARVSTIAGQPIRFADDVDVAPDGLVYFSDASSRFGKDELMLDVLEGRPHGSLIAYDPTTSETQVALDGLYFANGVAVALDGSFVLVAETFRYRIRRLWLAGPDSGRNEVLIENLPGFPDGVSASPRGTFWVAFFTTRNGLLDRVLHPRPWAKRLVAGLPRALQSQAAADGLVLEIDADGRVLRSLQDPGGKRVGQVTSVEEHDGHLYLGSLDQQAVPRVWLER